MTTQGVPAALMPARVEQFLHHRRRCGYTKFRSTRSLRSILAYLASIGAIEGPRAADRRPACPLLQWYVDYLLTERGLTAPSVRQYATTAARFLAAQADVRRLSAADVTAFVLRESRRYSIGTTKLAVTALRSFLRYLHVTGEIEADRTGAGAPTEPVFPARHGGALSRDAVARLLKKHTTAATATCPALKNKTVSPHVLRHTTAVSLLQAGVDRAVIALILGHESVDTTQMYLDADLATKERALALTAPVGVPHGRFRPSDTLLAFLQAL